MAASTAILIIRVIEACLLIEAHSGRERGNDEENKCEAKRQLSHAHYSECDFSHYRCWWAHGALP